tara:strand:+ start:512 stop:661 length:150 start_codon:yes stop_codon:yes gene_type:complete
MDNKNIVSRKGKLVSIPRGSLVIPKKITQILQKLMKQKPQKVKKRRRKK